MKIYQNICLRSFSHLPQVPPRAPKGITITKVCVRIDLCEGDSRGTISRLFLSFSSFDPSGAISNTRPTTSQSTHSVSLNLQPTRGETENESGVEGAYFQRLTVNKHVVCRYLTEGFCSGVGRFLMNFPSTGPSTPTSPTHVHLWVKSVMNHTLLWLAFISDTFGTVFFFFGSECCWDTMRQLNKSEKTPWDGGG